MDDKTYNAKLYSSCYEQLLLSILNDLTEINYERSFA